MPLAPDREANNNPAYLLGRLWSVLHDLEIAATGDPCGIIGHGKFASTINNPAAALKHMAHAKVWEAKLRRKGIKGDHRVAIANARNRQITALVDRIDPQARPVGMEASQWFILGYWHQRAADRRDEKAPKPALAEA